MNIVEALTAHQQNPNTTYIAVAKSKSDDDVYAFYRLGSELHDPELINYFVESASGTLQSASGEENFLSGDTHAELLDELEEHLKQTSLELPLDFRPYTDDIDLDQMPEFVLQDLYRGLGEFADLPDRDQIALNAREAEKRINALVTDAAKDA